jgi:hypothetical protein
MSSTVALEDSNDASMNNSTTIDHRFDDLTTEHIVIEDESADQGKQPTVIRKREFLKNHVLGMITEITFYEEGFLKIREGNKKKLHKEHILELRFIDPDPVTVRQIATPWLWSSLAVAVTAIVAMTLLPATGFARYSLFTSVILAATGIGLFAAFVYRSKVSHFFCTASGKTEVVSLTGSFGCFSRARSMSKKVATAIERACEDSGIHDVRYLRAEMQAHYKLAETGVITREECSDGTALILSKFG